MSTSVLPVKASSKRVICGRSRRLRRLECGADIVQHLILGALRRNQVLDRTPHTDQSNWRLLDRRTAPVSTAL
jgi:hypothetical protein